MAITIKQKIMVGKDRALDELSEMTSGSKGYWHFKEKDKKLVSKIGRLLSLPDNDATTLVELDKAGYINGDEEQFYSKR